ncbi:MAG: hypothetical protein WCA91_18110 [Candidatus Acidiferrales bacterium]
MQKAYLYEAILLVNRGLDEAVQGLERLKRVKDSGLDAACFEEKVTLFEIHAVPRNQGTRGSSEEEGAASPRRVITRLGQGRRKTPRRATGHEEARQPPAEGREEVQIELRQNPKTTPN